MSELDSAWFPDLSATRVLVVDDLAFGRSLTRSLLLAAGVGVVESAPDAARAWQVLCDTPPDLVILDWELPGTSGLELLRRIRAPDHHVAPDLPVLMLTAYREEKRVREAIAAGATSYLTKPFTPRDLLLKMRFCIEQAPSPRRYVGEASGSGLLVD